MALSKVPYGVIAPVVQKCKEVVDATGVVTHVWGYNSAPDHNNKRCIDFMVRSIADGNKVANYIWANRSRLGIRLMIWNHRIISTYAASSGRPAGVWWRYNGPNPHTDHPHVEFDSSAYRSPSGGTPKPSTGTSPKPTPTPKKGFLMDKDPVRRNRTKDVKVGKKWKTLPVNNDGAYSLATGSARVLNTATFDVEIPKDGTLQVRYTTVDYEKGKKTKIVTTFPIAHEALPTTGRTFFQVMLHDWIGKGAGKASRRVRIQARVVGSNTPAVIKALRNRTNVVKR